MKKLAPLLVVLVPFAAASLYLVGSQGLLPLLAVADAPWGLQVVVDLFIMLGLFSIWMVRDAKERGISPWPHVAAVLALGSIGALGYLVYRSVKEPSASRAGEGAAAAG